MRAPPSELLHEVQGLRRLAQRLARDGAAAEDLLQELWLRAWQGGPPDAGRRRPWLVRVLTNLARKHRRGERRRAGREQRLALPGETSGALEVAERIEAQRLLLEALAALEEPFRSTLVLRYQDELAPAEIARRLGVPPGTVRWRIHEGLSRLRARLDQRPGGRETWLLACAPLFPRSTSELVRAPTTWPLLLGIGMNTTLKLGLAAAALGLVALPVWLSTRGEPALSAARAEEGTGTSAAALHETPSAEPPRAAPGEREAARPSGSTAPRTAEPTPTAEPTIAAEPLARIAGRVLDARRRPLPAARAELEGGSPRAGRADCDAAGRFELTLPHTMDAAPGLELHLRAPGHASQVVRVNARPRETVQVGDVVLADGARVAGRVTTSRGDPAAGVLVVVAHPRASAGEDQLSGPLLEPESASATSDERGGFEADDAPAGMVSVWARRPGADAEDEERRSAWARSEVFELDPGSAREDLELVLPLDDGFGETAIAGVVRAPGGEPVPRANVRVESRSPEGSIQTTVVADEQGRFLFDPRRASVADLLAQDPAESWRPASARGVRGGTHDVELVLAEPRWIELAVHDARGVAPPEFAVLEYRLLASGREEWPRTRPGREGALRLSLPIDPFRLEVLAPGFERARLGPFEPERAPAELECELTALPGLRGRVSFEGRPVAGARLELRRYPTPAQHVESNGFPQKVWCETEETATSDGEGRFLLTGREAGTRVILCLADGYALAELGPLAVEPARGVSDLALELSRGGTLAGEVRTAPGVDPAGVIVGANRFDAHPRTVRADEHGRFRFEHLTRGPWRIERVRRELEPAESGWMVDDQREADDPRSAPNCTVTDGATTEFVLDLSSELSARLRAHLEVDGAAAAGWSIVLWPVGVNTFEGDLPGGRLDDEGRLACEVEPGRYWVRFQHGEGSGFNGVAELELELPGGETPLEAGFATASLAGRYLGDPSGVIAVWSAQAAGGYRTETYLGLDEQGRFARDLVLAGTGELRIVRKGAGAEVVVRRALELRPGERGEVELP